jgi:hypothetical protein
MDDDGGLQFSHEPQDRFSIADVHRVMLVAVNFRGKSSLDPAGIAVRAKKNGTLIVVDTGNPKAKSMEVNAHFGSD